MALQFPVSPTIGQEFDTGSLVYTWDGDSWVVLESPADPNAIIQTIVLEGADGSGSGLDADLLDGNDSAYFTNYTDARETAITAAYQSYTDARETAITTAYQTYTNQAEADAISTSNSYTDAREVAITTAYQTYTDQAEVDAVNAANSYTDARETAITTAYTTAVSTAQSTAISTANSYTDTRETAITSAYQAYANASESDAITTANAYTDTQVANLISSAPATLDTLNELAAALGDDPNFATSITTQIGTKVSKSGDTMTGPLTLSANPTANLHAATKAYVDSVASGVTGGAVASADKWTTARTVSFATGDVTGAFTIDGSANVTNVVMTVADDSHNHIIANVDGLQTALNGKASSSHTHAIADVTGLQTALDSKLNSSSYTASDVLAKIKTVDGSGSGLDADTLDGLQATAFASSGHTHSYLPLTGGTLSGDVLIQKNNAWLTLDSASTGGNGVEQGAGISIGESGYKGSAALHLTYTGDGYGHIGMGAVNATTNLPAYEAMTLYYVNNTVRFTSTPNVAGSTVWHAGNDGTGSGLDADLLDGVQGGGYLRSNANDTFTGKLSVGSTTSRQAGMYGIYDSTKTGHIWSMGTSYAIAADGSTFGNMYGLAYKHTNNATGGTMAGSHQAVWCINGTGTAALGSNIWTSGDVTAFSDARVKTNLEKIDNAVDKVLQLNGYTFERTDKDDNDKRYAGVIAQEVLEVLPEVVTGGPTEEDPEGHYSVAYGNIVALLIEGMKEQQSQIDALKAEIEILKDK